MSFSKIKSLGLFGLNAFEVDVEVNISKGQPMFEIVGLPDASVRESRERIRTALNTVNMTLPPSRIIVNLAPADLKKSGTMHDLAILVGILQAMGRIPVNLDDSCFLGEISLNGRVRKVNGVLPMVLLARENKFKNVYVPIDNAFEASAADGLNVYGVDTISKLLMHLQGNTQFSPQTKYIPKQSAFDNLPDFSDVKGQLNAKKALEIAVAGGHNALMIGSPGSGKSMLAKRIPSILPAMTFEESLETTKIYSICGELDSDSPFITNRPFRSPHHTVSSAGLVGGGSIPHPGEVSLAHNGFLFLDELAEFDKRSLDILRQPLEDRKVTISRASGSVTYPCSFMLVGAMNPCPCGYYGHPKRKCTCSSKQVRKYLSRISGPLLDRFDLHIEVAPVEISDLFSNKKAESSETIRKRVQAAREIQNERFKGTEIHCNALIPPDKLDKFCVMDNSARKILGLLFQGLDLNARAYDRILKVARTIADLEQAEVISRNHIAVAAQQRCLDRKYWLAGS
jgi:magnesium chelatase family protein